MGRNRVREKLLEAFRHKPEEYYWDGDVEDLGDVDGECACGHDIRYVYTWHHHDGHSVEVGSVCTENVPELNQEMRSKIKKDAKNRKKAKKTQRQDQVAPEITLTPLDTTVILNKCRVVASNITKILLRLKRIQNRVIKGVYINAEVLYFWNMATDCRDVAYELDAVHAKYDWLSKAEEFAIKAQDAVQSTPLTRKELGELLSSESHRRQAEARARVRKRWLAVSSQACHDVH